MKVLYEARATATGGRDGRVSTDDGTLDLRMTLPKALGGTGAVGNNPEQLFACGYAACFDNALMHVQTAAVLHAARGPGAGHGAAHLPTRHRAAAPATAPKPSQPRSAPAR